MSETNPPRPNESGSPDIPDQEGVNAEPPDTPSPDDAPSDDTSFGDEDGGTGRDKNSIGNIRMK